MMTNMITKIHHLHTIIVTMKQTLRNPVTVLHRRNGVPRIFVHRGEGFWA